MKLLDACGKSRFGQAGYLDDSGLLMLMTDSSNGMNVMRHSVVKQVVGTWKMLPLTIPEDRFWEMQNWLPIAPKSD